MFATGRRSIVRVRKGARCNSLDRVGESKPAAQPFTSRARAPSNSISPLQGYIRKITPRELYRRRASRVPGSLFRLFPGQTAGGLNRSRSPFRENAALYYVANSCMQLYNSRQFRAAAMRANMFAVRFYLSRNCAAVSLPRLRTADTPSFRRHFHLRCCWYRMASRNTRAVLVRLNIISDCPRASRKIPTRVRNAWKWSESQRES